MQQLGAAEADTEGMQAAALSPRSLRLPSGLLRAASDERLVAALRSGDEKAFEEIYDRHHGSLLGFCRHMLGSHEEAEDALQHVFVSAHRHLCEGSARINLKPWLYAIARNRCLSMLRARRETLALDDMHEPSGDGLAVADEVELGEDLKEMLGDISRLPDDQRAALVLAELGDLSQQEIAATLDVRTDKVKALIFQAREALAGWRQARAAGCGEIREQLATLEGSALRRAPIRRHVALCPACAAFEGEVKRQRATFSLLLPVIPSVALKHNVLAGALSAGHGAAATGASGAVAAGAAASGAGAGASGLAVKALVVAALAVGAGGGGVVAVRELDRPRPLERPAAATTTKTSAAPAGVAAPVVTPATAIRRPGLPAASRQHPATSTSPVRKTRHGRTQAAPGGSNAPKALGRGRQQSAARSAPGRQQSATHSAPGRQRSATRNTRPQAPSPRPAAKTHPAPATPRLPIAAEPTVTERKATLPASVRGKGTQTGRTG
jgi:RNA polymerase sigma factor (sigma-70 family)